MIDDRWNNRSIEGLWDLGCCLICKKSFKNCWCEKVLCQDCSWYEGKTKQNKKYNGLKYLKGNCTFPSSLFHFPDYIEADIKKETTKAYLIKMTWEEDLFELTFWAPKKGCEIGGKKGIEDEFLSLKGWFLLLKTNEYNKIELTDKEEMLSDIFYDMSMECYLE